MDSKLSNPPAPAIEYQSPATARADRRRIRLAHDCLVLGWFALLLIVPVHMVRIIYLSPLEYVIADAILLLLGICSLRISSAIRRSDVPSMRRAVVAAWFAELLYIFLAAFWPGDGETRFYLAAIAVFMAPMMIVIATLALRAMWLAHRMEVVD